MYFCPVCANLLLVEEQDGNQLFCQACPYVSKITKPISQKKVFKPKQVDDILGGDDAWENVDSTEASCPKCGHNRAYFMLIQIRSADEPSTAFYKCCECRHDWREN
ncbi:DNA-directed RNA polymerase III subunit RPC10 [Boothiomyces sp. JEL0866]|nr:DNA-directed RNA polymerase III subunit RPC10 [Boothiomyces sp. JEL0866]